MERGIIFSGQMVKAILDGRKTQTRRVIKPQPIWKGKPTNSLQAAGWLWEIKSVKYSSFETRALQEELVKHCPYGQKGDRLYVRECYGIVSKKSPLIKQTLPMFEYTCFCRDGNDRIRTGYELIYKATQNIDPDFPIRWRPSIHMPKWAARIWLEITNIRIERVQDIDNDWEDCLKEGVMGKDEACCDVNGLHQIVLFKFIELWDSINAKRGYSWQTNPWVFVISFKKIDFKAAAQTNMKKTAKRL